MRQVYKDKIVLAGVQQYTVHPIYYATQANGWVKLLDLLPLIVQNGSLSLEKHLRYKYHEEWQGHLPFDAVKYPMPWTTKVTCTQSLQDMEHLRPLFSDPVQLALLEQNFARLRNLPFWTTQSAEMAVAEDADPPLKKLKH